MSVRRAVLLACILAVLGCSGKKDKDQVTTAQPQQQQQQAAVAAKPEIAPVIVTDAAGMTVYFHDNDKPMKSRCNGSCEEFWPPVRPDPNFVPAGKLSVLQRQDGTQQLAYDGRPLYTFKFDQKPGDKKGDGKQGVWHVMRY